MKKTNNINNKYSSIRFLKTTLIKLKKFKLTPRESYDEIINRILDKQQEVKQKNENRISKR